MNSREQVLARIRESLTDVAERQPQIDVPVPWVYGAPTPMPDLLERFVERVEDYKATVVRCDAKDLPTRIADAMAVSGAQSLVVPDGVPEAWLTPLGGLRVVRDRVPLTHLELDEVDAVLTGAAVGIAETGTIVLDHRTDQGRRALTLVPDLHICVIRADQVTSDVPEAVARLAAALADRQPLTWISGPSATSDIELSRVEGVHGPRTLHVLLVLSQPSTGTD